MDTHKTAGHIDIHLKNYLAHLEALKYKPKSINSYRIALNKFRLYLSENQINRMQDVTLNHIERYRLLLVDEDFTESSIHLYLRSVRKLFAYLEETQTIFVSPAAGMILPKPNNKLQPVPSEQEAETLLSMPDVTTPLGIRDRAFMETLYSTGVRLEELVTMDIIHVDIKQGTVRVWGKNDKERVVPFGKQAAFWTRNYLKTVRPKLSKNNPDQHALWLGKMGRRINPLIVERLLCDYSIKGGITPTVSPHGLRRACATHMLKKGAHPVEIQMLLGHASLKALSQYLKITIRDLRKMHNRSKPGK